MVVVDAVHDERRREEYCIKIEVEKKKIERGTTKTQHKIIIGRATVFLGKLIDKYFYFNKNRWNEF